MCARVLLLLAALTLGACGSDDAREPQPSPATSDETAVEETDPPAVEPTPDVEVAPHSPRQATPILSPEDAQRAREQVRAARAQLASGDPAALATFRQLIETLPPDPRILCEGGFVAHSAEEDELALEWIERGLTAYGPPDRVPDRERVHLGQCLYNLGLAHERREHPVNAIEALRQPVAIRPNTTVQRRLDRLEAGTSVPARPAIAGSPPSPEATSAEALIADLERGACNTAQGERRPSDGCAEVELECDHDIEQTIRSEDRAAQVVRIDVTLGDGSMDCELDADDTISYWYLVLSDGDAHHAMGPFADDFSPSNDSGIVDVEGLAWLDPGGSTLAMSVTSGDCFPTFVCCEPYDQRKMLVCSLAGDAPRCASLDLGNSNCVCPNPDMDDEDLCGAARAFGARVELREGDTLRVIVRDRSIDRPLPTLLDECALGCSVERWLDE